MKRKYPGVLLMFEVGYKIVFYGEDAQVKHLLLVLEYLDLPSFR